jgi:hypothetical protein
MGQELQGLQAATSDVEGHLKHKLRENEGLTLQLNQLTSDLEEMRAQNQGTLSRLDIVKQQTEDSQEVLQRRLITLETLRGILNGCLRGINQFCRHFDHLSKLTPTVRVHVSKKFRDLMLLFVNVRELDNLTGIDEAAKTVEECLQASMDEVEVPLLLRKL